MRNEIDNFRKTMQCIPFHFYRFCEIFNIQLTFYINKNLIRNIMKSILLIIFLNTYMRIFKRITSSFKALLSCVRIIKYVYAVQIIIWQLCEYFMIAYETKGFITHTYVHVRTHVKIIIIYERKQCIYNTNFIC